MVHFSTLNWEIYVTFTKWNGIQISVQSSYQNVVNLQFSLLDLLNDKTAVEVTESKSNKLKSLH